MSLKNYLGKTVSVTIDRPMGSKHPKYQFLYPLNYGHLKGIKSGDNEDLDAYIIGVFEPKEKYQGIVIAIIIREDDNDPKLIVAPKNKDYTDEAIWALVEFQERFFKGYLVRKKS